jgi:hypothetical protein
MEVLAILLKHEIEECVVDTRRLALAVDDTLYRTWRSRPTLGGVFRDAEEFRQRDARECAESKEEIMKTLARKRAEDAAQRGAGFVRRMQYNNVQDS